MLIKKLLIIIITALALTSSLYARGVTENVAREGVKGVYTYLEDLSKAGKDERIPEAEREEVVEKVYSGMTFEEAAADYIKKEESVSSHFSQPALPVKTMESAPVRTETAEPVKAEVITPQIEEEKMPVQIEEKQTEKSPIEEKQPEKKAEETSALKVEDVVNPAAEEPVYSDTLSYKGLSSTITVDNTTAALTVPAGIGKDDIDRVAFIVSAAYPEEASLVTYSFDNGVLTLYYPAQTDEFLLSLMSTLKEGGMYLIDLYGEVGTAAVGTATTADKTTCVAASVTEESPVYQETLTYKGVTSAVTVNTTYTTFTIPAGMDADDIESVAWLVNYLYPEEASLLTYSVDGDTITVTYPEQTSQFLLSALAVLREEAMALIDDIAASGETATAEEKGAVYEDTLSYRNVTSKVAVYNTYAVLTLPEGMSAVDVKAVAEMIAAEYKNEAALVTYSLEGNTLTLMYPGQSDAFLLGAVDVLRAEAVAYIDSLEKPVVKAEAPVETPASVAETTAYPEVSPVSAPVVETTKTGSSALSSPSAVLEKKKGGVFSYDITLSLMGKFVYYKGSDHIYPTLSFSMRDTFADSFYLEAGVDVFAYINNDKLYAVSGVNLNAGFNVPVNNFDFYFYSGLRYQLASSTSSFKSGLSVTVGMGIDWRMNDHFIAGAGYEYYGSASLFAFFLKYRF